MRTTLVTALYLSYAAALRFFDPITRFGPVDEPPLRVTKPLLLVLPGLDGSGITAWAQYPELAREYSIRALSIPADDRTSYEALVGLCAAQIADARKDGYSAVVLLGESMGAGIALDVARCEPPTALVLVSPAGQWCTKTWLGRMRVQLLNLNDTLLGLVVALTAYQLFDLGMMRTTVQRILSGEKAPILDTPERTAYAWKVVQAMPEMFAQPPATLRHRLEQWVVPSIDAGKDLSDLRVPMLLVAGTADLRVPAADEARRIAAEAPAECRCAIHLVAGAGHAGVTDERIDLRALIERWRDGGGVLSEPEHESCQQPHERRALW